MILFLFIIHWTVFIQLIKIELKTIIVFNSNNEHDINNIRKKTM